MPEDLLTDPFTFRASGREELPTIFALLAPPGVMWVVLQVIQASAFLYLLVVLQAACCLWLILLSFRRLLIRYRLSETHLLIPCWFKHVAVSLEGLELTHEPKRAWFPGRMTVKSDSLPKPGLFYLPDSWVNGEAERERFLQALSAHGVKLNIPGFRREPQPMKEERLISACTGIPNGWEKAGAWIFAWSIGLGLYFAAGRAPLEQHLWPLGFAVLGLAVFFFFHQRRLSKKGDICFKGDFVSLEREGQIIWEKRLSDCEAVHCTYSWPAQMPRRKLILRSNDDEHLSLTAWQIEEDRHWIDLCEALRKRGCRILIEEADDRDVPHKDE